MELRVSRLRRKYWTKNASSPLRNFRRQSGHHKVKNTSTNPRGWQQSPETLVDIPELVTTHGNTNTPTTQNTHRIESTQLIDVALETSLPREPYLKNPFLLSKSSQKF